LFINIFSNPNSKLDKQFHHENDILYQLLSRKNVLLNSSEKFVLTNHLDTIHEFKNENFLK